MGAMVADWLAGDGVRIVNVPTLGELAEALAALALAHGWEARVMVAPVANAAGGFVVRVLEGEPVRLTGGFVDAGETGSAPAAGFGDGGE